MPMESPQLTPIQPPPPVQEPGHPVASLVLGIVGMIAWILPILGLPITITGLVFGIKALKRTQKGMAIAGVVLCAIGLTFSTINCAVGAYLGATGQHPLVNKALGR